MPTTKLPKPIVISNFQSGIGDSPLLGFGDMRNVIINSPAGIVKAGLKLQRTTQSFSTQNVLVTAVNTSTDTLTLQANLEADVPIYYNAFTISNVGGSLPGGLLAATTYFMIRVDATHIKVATSLEDATNGVAIDITSAGSGTNTINQILPKRINCFERVNGVMYGLDIDGRLWFDAANGVSISTSNQGQHWNLITGNTLPTAGLGGAGLIYWKGYLAVFRRDYVDFLDPATNTWVATGVFGATSMTNHQPVSGQDGLMYFLNGNLIASLAEKPAKTFNPADSTTYNYNSSALDLPEPTSALAEFGTNLFIGSISGKLYPWDRISSSFTMPVELPEYNIVKILSANNIAYVLCGDTGTIYYTNGSGYSVYKTIPAQLIDRNYQGAITWGDADFLKDRLIFTIEGPLEQYIGSVNLVTGVLKVENKPSIGYGGATSNVKIVFGGLFSLDGVSYIASYGLADGSEHVTDNINGPSLIKVYDNYEALIISAQYVVGDAINKRTFNKFHFELIDKLSAGHGLKFYWRENLSDSWTQVGQDFTYATYSAVKSFSLPFAVQVESLQIKVLIAGTSLSSPGLSIIKIS